MTNKEATLECRALGYVLRWQPEWCEYALYPLGEPMDGPTTYYTDDLADALATCRAITAQNKEATP